MGHTFPTTAVIHLSTGAELLSPPCIFPKSRSCLCLRLNWELNLFFRPCPSAGWVLVSLTITKKLPVHGENAETSLGDEDPAQQHHSCATVAEGPKGHCSLQEWAESFQCEERSQKGEVFKAMGSAASEDEALGRLPFFNTWRRQHRGMAPLTLRAHTSWELMHKPYIQMLLSSFSLKSCPSLCNVQKEQTLHARSGGPGLQQAVTAVSRGFPQGSVAHT